MEHYNMLIIEEESPGLRVIQTNAYQYIISNNPGLIHENCGDFYSKVHVDELAEAIYRALDKDFMGSKLNKDLIVVDALTFNPEVVEMEKDYIIRELKGVRIYSPKLHTSEAENVNLAYSFFGVMALENLFSDGSGPYGSLQLSLLNKYDEFGTKLAINTIKRVIAEEEKRKTCPKTKKEKSYKESRS